MGGGGGGGSSVQMRNPSQEKGTVGNWYDFQNNQYQNYVQSNPLLKTSQQGALGFWNQLPGMLNQFPGLQNQVQGYQNQLGGYQDQLGSLYGNAQNQIGGYQKQLGDQSSTLGGWLGGPNGISATIANQGALTPGLSRDVSQQTRNIASAQGTAASPGALGNELLNRDAYRQQRFNTALQQGQGIIGQQSGLAGQGASLTGLLSQIGQGAIALGGSFVGQGAGLVNQIANLFGQKQALQTGALNQNIGVQNAETQNASGTFNPILGYLGNLFGGNQQASIAKAQIDAQQQAASQGKGAGLASGGASIIASVLPLLAASDERMKSKIKATGLKTVSGVPLKTFEYKTRPGVPFIGVMAQDVEKKFPWAAITDPTSGIKMVMPEFAPVQIKKES